MCPSKNMKRGSDFERELVNKAKDKGLAAVRAWGSNGASIGEHAEVDLKVNGFKVQAKRRKTLPAYLQIPDSCDIVAFKQDRKEPLVLMTYNMFTEILSEWGEAEYWLTTFAGDDNNERQKS